MQELYFQENFSMLAKQIKDIFLNRASSSVLLTTTTPKKL